MRVSVEQLTEKAAFTDHAYAYLLHNYKQTVGATSR